MDLAARRESGPVNAPISPRLELGAYEALWLKPEASFKTIAERFSADPESMPSDFVSHVRAEECASRVFALLKEHGVHRFGIRINHAGEYPKKLRDAKNPVELLYFRGFWELTETRCIAVVGTRKPSADGIARTKRLVKELVSRKFTIVSGLATGIDTTVHTTAIEAGGRTIAVIGTPLGTVYPKENSDLQDRISNRHLVISQVPVLRYAKQYPPQNRLFFPERNATMSAFIEATIIVEAGETSGTLTQAKAANYQGRKVFILDSNFQRQNLTWPRKLLKRGAIRVREPEDIWRSIA